MYLNESLRRTASCLLAIPTLYVRYSILLEWNGKNHGDNCELHTEPQSIVRHLLTMTNFPFWPTSVLDITLPRLLWFFYSSALTPCTPSRLDEKVKILQDSDALYSQKTPSCCPAKV